LNERCYNTPAAAGTGIALLGTYLYTEASKRHKASAAPPPSPPTTPTGTANAI